MLILDSNVVSELMNAEPNATVISWLDRQAWKPAHPLEIGKRESSAETQGVQHELERQLRDRYRPTRACACASFSVWSVSAAARWRW